MLNRLPLNYSQIFFIILLQLFSLCSSSFSFCQKTQHLIISFSLLLSRCLLLVRTDVSGFDPHIMFRLIIVSFSFILTSFTSPFLLVDLVVYRKKFSVTSFDSFFPFLSFFLSLSSLIPSPLSSSPSHLSLYLLPSQIPSSTLLTGGWGYNPRQIWRVAYFRRRVLVHLGNKKTTV